MICDLMKARRRFLPNVNFSSGDSKDRLVCLPKNLINFFGRKRSSLQAFVANFAQTHRKHIKSRTGSLGRQIQSTSTGERLSPNWPFSAQFRFIIGGTTTWLDGQKFK
jgi:hypothetical protein